MLIKRMKLNKLIQAYKYHNKLFKSNCNKLIIIWNKIILKNN